jgi:hypothetical protein
VRHGVGKPRANFLYGFGKKHLPHSFTVIVSFDIFPEGRRNLVLGGIRRGLGAMGIYQLYPEILEDT